MSAIDILKAFEEAFEAPDWPDRVRALCTPDCEFLDLGARAVTDLEGFIKTETDMTAAWSDVSAEQIALVGDERTAMVELEYTGTQNGPLNWHGRKFPPSGRPWTLRIIRCITVEDGKITSIRDYFDGLTLMQQLGMPVEEAESAGSAG